MDEWPDIKPPSEFTGNGFEIIGDPSNPRATGTLWFQDGVFNGFQLGKPDSDGKPTDHREDLIRRRAADLIALRLMDDPEDVDALDKREEILKQCRNESEKRTIRRAIKSIADGRPAKHWPARTNLQRAALMSLMGLSESFGRPPTRDETIDRMRETVDPINPPRKLTAADKEQKKHSSEALRIIGFEWLIHTPQGFQGKK